MNDKDRQVILLNCPHCGQQATLPKDFLNKHKEIDMREPETPLQKEVAMTLITLSQERTGETFEERIKEVYDELAEHGCASGIIPNMTYFKDTSSFYKRHKQEMSALLTDCIESTGMPIHEIFGDKWDAEDPLAFDCPNQNLLAWYGFEETARRLMEGDDD